MMRQVYFDLQVNQANQCDAAVTAIKQVHLITQMDALDGLLVHFTGERVRAPAQLVEWEVHVKPREKFVLIKPFGDIARIKYMKVRGVATISVTMSQPTTYVSKRFTYLTPTIFVRTKSTFMSQLIIPQ